MILFNGERGGIMFLNKKNIGWICPKCQRSLAPFLSSCPFCESKAYDKKDNSDISVARVKEYNGIIDEWLNGKGGE